MFINYYNASKIFLGIYSRYLLTLVLVSYSSRLNYNHFLNLQLDLPNKGDFKTKIAHSRSKYKLFWFRESDLLKLGIPTLDLDLYAWK